MVSLLTVRTRLYEVEPINYDLGWFFWLLISYSISINYSYVEKIKFIYSEKATKFE